MGSISPRRCFSSIGRRRKERGRSRPVWAGETISEAEAVERLIAEGPPPPSPSQQRLGDLIRTIGKLNADQEERLLATARELAEEPGAA